MWVEKFGCMRLLFSRTCQSLACYSVQVFPWKAWRSYLNSLVFLEFGQSTFYISCYFSMQCGGFLGCFPAGWAVSCAALCSGCCLELFWGKSNHKSLPAARGQAWVDMRTRSILGCVYLFPQFTCSPLRRYLQQHLPNGFSVGVPQVQGWEQLGWSGWWGPSVSQHWVFLVRLSLEERPHWGIQHTLLGAGTDLHRE